MPSLQLTALDNASQLFEFFIICNSLVQVKIIPYRNGSAVPLWLCKGTYRYDTGTVPTIPIGTLPWYEVRTLTELLYSVKLFPYLIFMYDQVLYPIIRNRYHGTVPNLPR
jgi:hypothetical protein